MTKGDLKLTKHHIIPTSRKGSKKDQKNIAMVKQHLHRKYHTLFTNKTPEEILDYLVNYYWGGRREFILNYLIERYVK